MQRLDQPGDVAAAVDDQPQAAAGVGHRAGAAAGALWVTKLGRGRMTRHVVLLRWTSPSRMAGRQMTASGH